MPVRQGLPRSLPFYNAENRILYFDLLFHGKTISEFRLLHECRQQETGNSAAVSRFCVPSCFFPICDKIGHSDEKQSLPLLFSSLKRNKGEIALIA
jgi:hypothetical protein